MTTVLAYVLMVGFVGGTVYVAVRLNRAMQFQYVTSTPVGVNDDQSAKDKFLELLHEAHRLMIIYDDGDKVPESIYMDAEIARSVKEKLDRYPEFSMQCLFNVDEPDLLFREVLKNTGPRLQIKMRDPKAPRLAIHYKIIDDGTKAYLSRHSPGASKRNFRIVDCSKVPEKHFGYVSNAVLGLYKKDFQQAFHAS